MAAGTTIGEVWSNTPLMSKIAHHANSIRFSNALKMEHVQVMSRYDHRSQSDGFPSFRMKITLDYAIF